MLVIGIRLRILNFISFIFVLIIFLKLIVGFIVEDYIYRSIGKCRNEVVIKLEVFFML